jgi:hypothetical protein
MIDQELFKKPGDPIRSEDWNTIVNELVALREYIDQMARENTLNSLESPTGTSYGLSKGVPEEFDYGTDIMGLITRQYFLGVENTGETCRFGIDDFAGIIYYWAAASRGDKTALRITLEYTDNSLEPSRDLFIHEWSRLRPRGENNPYYEYLLSPNQRVMYRYALENPNPDKAIRYIIFEDLSPECGLRIGNIIHYVTRVRPITKV